MCLITTAHHMSAPILDNALDRLDNRTMNSMPYVPGTADKVLKFFRIIDAAIKPCGDDDRHELWIELPRGPIEDFGDFQEALEYGDVENYEEFEKEWIGWYPNETKWYSFTCVHYKNSYGIWIGHKCFIQIDVSATPAPFGLDPGDALDWLTEYIECLIPLVRSNRYNEYVNKHIPDIHRTGTITYQQMLQIYPDWNDELKTNNVTDEDLHRFSSHVQYLKDHNISYTGKKLPFMTGNIFLGMCKVGYNAMGYKTKGKNPVQCYTAYADGRDDDLLKINLDSPDAFKEWFFDRSRFGGHPWEVCRGGNSTHISFAPHYDEDGWIFYLSGSSFVRSRETMQFYMALVDLEVPVVLVDGEEMAARITQTALIGLVPDQVTPVYCQSYFPGQDILDFMNLSSVEEPEFRDKIAAAAIWRPIQPVLYNTEDNPPTKE